MADRGNLAHWHSTLRNTIWHRPGSGIFFHPSLIHSLYTFTSIVKSLRIKSPAEENKGDLEPGQPKNGFNE
ncbi:hypothetical Protein YC6258_05862 [Gynuella sunshinyii YC6258]|uniref:Uncharacterized protein n=1 Tax=Gynuella sunshinyii YC6258 TaxID=1445510 RepID=A0A0C5VF46_9GAMM|nr:hypothetical Protein YC6258_05862 [Gynuella sunshinyii YC6258]